MSLYNLSRKYRWVFQLVGGVKLPYSAGVWRRIYVLRRLKIEVDFPRRILVIFCTAINILYICSFIWCAWNHVILLLNRNDLKEYRMGSKSSLLSAKLTLLHLLAKLATLEASASSSASQSYPIVELLCISIVAHLVNYLQQEKVKTKSPHYIWLTIPVGYSCLSAIKTGFCLLWPHRYVGWSTIWQFSWVHEKNTNPEPLVPWQGKRSDVKLCESLISNTVKMVHRFPAFQIGTNCDIWWTSPCGRICMSVSNLASWRQSCSPNILKLLSILFRCI